MAFKGTAKRKPGDVEEEVKSYGGMINASTGLDGINYYVTIPKERAKNALELMEDILFHPAFDAEEFKKEQDVILKEIKLTRDDPGRRVINGLWQTAYLRHPYKMPIIGYEELFKGLTRDDLLKYYEERYMPNNIVLTVVGDIKEVEALSWIKSLFLKDERKRIGFNAAPEEPGQNSGREYKDFMQINLGYFAMGYHTIELSDRDLYALDVLGIVLGDWDGSRLNKKLVKDEELLYTVSSFNYTPKYPGLFIVYGIGDYRNLEKAKEKILEEAKKIKRNGLGNYELQAAKNMVISGYINSLETTSGLASALSQSEFLAGDPAFFERYVGNIRKVDNESVKEAARKYLDENNLTISYLYPEYARKIGTVPEGDCPYFSAKPQKITLPNGMRLILKEEHRLPKISVVCVFLGGVRTETEENNGISNLTSAMLLKGTKKRKESDIKAFLESTGGEITHFSGKNTFGLSLDFLRDDADSALKVLEDVIKNSSFPEKELGKEKEKLYAAVKSEDDDIYDLGFLKLKKAVFENHPYGLRVIGEIASIEKLTRKDIEAFHKRYCAPNNMVVSLVGDFDGQKLAKKIEALFGGMREAPFSVITEKPAPLAGPKDANYDMEREQSLALAGFRGAALADRDRYSLDVLTSVLSGENGRLYQSIRNKLGLSYSLGAISEPGIDTGYIAFYVATDKAHLNEAKALLLEELAKIKEGAIPEEEIALAKESLIGRQKIALEADKAIAYQMALDEIYGIGYDDYEKYEERIRGLTAAEIIEAAKKYIDLGHFAAVTVSGKEEPRNE